MMTDVVERLNSLLVLRCLLVKEHVIAADAKTEIEKLRAENKQLREDLDTWKSVFPDVAPESVLPDRSKIEEENKKLRAKNKRLQAALEPFAKSANAFDQLKHFKPEECFVYGGQSRPDGNVGAITVGDLRRARAALEGR